MEATVNIRPKSAKSRWVALDINNNIVSEGTKPEEVEKEAKKLIDVFFLVYIPKEGVRYFY